MPAPRSRARSKTSVASPAGRGAGAPRPEGGLSRDQGRLQLIYSALEETDDAKRNQTCRDIVQGRCPKPECKADDDD